MRYRYHLALALALALILCCIYVSHAIYESAKQDAIAELNSRQMLHAKQAAKGIGGFFEYWIRTLKDLSGKESIVNLTGIGRKEMESFYGGHRAEIAGLTRLDARGRILYTVPFSKGSIGADVSEQQHVREIMKTRKPVVSDVFRAVQGFDAIAVHVPVFKGPGYDGTIGVLVRFEALAQSYLEDIKIGKTGYAWVTSRDGRELYCPVPGHVGRPVFETCKEFPSILAMANEMLQGKEGTATYFFNRVRGQSVETIKKYAVYTPVRTGTTFWSIVVASSEDEVLAALVSFRNRLLVITGLLLLAGAILVYSSLKAWVITKEEEKRQAAEEGLRETNNRLAGIVNFLPVATFVVDREGRIIVWNKAIEEMTGVSAEAMLGKGDYEYALPFYGKRRPILVDFVFLWNEEIAAQYSFIRKEGDTLFTETDVPFVRGQNRILWGKASPIYDITGNIIGAIESIREVTEEKEVARRLADAEEQFRTLFETSTNAILIRDRNGIVTMVNTGAIKLFGAAVPDDLIGRQYLDLVYPEDRHFSSERVEMIFQAAERGSKAGETADASVAPREHRMLKLNGETVFVESTGVAFRHKGRMAIQGIFRDITDWKQAEDALRQAEEKYRTIFENSIMGIFQTTPEGSYLGANRALARMYGYDSPEELIRSVTDVSKQIYVDPHKRTEFLDCIEKEGFVINFEAERYRKDGSKIWTLLDARAVRDETGNTLYYEGTTEDITERKRLESQLLQAQKMEAIGTLAGGVAHAFNNILMGIQGYVSLMMLEIDKDHPYYGRLERIEEQVQSAADLTKQLLGFARGGRYETKPLNINELVKKTLSMFGRTRKEITITGKYADDLWAVQADQSQIEQVLINLYVNAWHAMPSGGQLFLETNNITLYGETARLHNLQPGRYVKVSVTDTGTGMDEKTRQRIFEPFFTTKEMGRGTGLGLAIVYGIIGGHGGAINVYSEPGCGTIFTIYLPASEQEILGERESVPEILRGTETILLVDDEAAVLTVTREVLESLGYTVFVAATGEEALASYEAAGENINLVILDMVMPGMSGGNTFEHLRALAPAVKAILSSGYAINGQAQKIIDRGCRGFLQKPYTALDLSRKIREVMDG